MGDIINSYIMPHPPIIVPGIGEGRETEASATINGCRKIAEAISADEPSTILISSPHAPGFNDYIVISDASRLAGDFGKFGHPEIYMDFDNNLPLASEIIRNAGKTGISSGFLEDFEKRQYGITDHLDHGALVPLFFIRNAFKKSGKNFKIVHFSTPFLPSEELYQFGKCIRQSVTESGERVVYIASGDLSHRLTHGAPAGYSPYGKPYDEKLVDIIRKGDAKGILGITEDDMELAGECGTRSFIILFGALDGYKISTEIFSYEGPFGVGYLAAKLHTL
ncbi:MAG: DODA-type extradiol aromatic ring-opening family dioxygenase [Saccharofermentanales bacterium]